MPPSSDRTSILTEVCDLLAQDQADHAGQVARQKYPFESIQAETRHYTESRANGLFLRDGYIDRYSGERLVCPGALRLLTVMLPDEFPAHPNWKMSETHYMYWELFPTVDHVVPIARGGKDEDENLVCTSMLRNQAKSNWLLSELGWELVPPGSMDNWDGLTGWFLKMYPKLGPEAKIPYLNRWYSAVERGTIQE